MTALPQPGRLLTIADYAALPEDDHYRWELLEGNLTMSPSPTPLDNYASGQLLLQLQPQLPVHLVALQGVDLDLLLAPPDQPGSARRPDLIVVERAAFERVRRGGGLLEANASCRRVRLPGFPRRGRYFRDSGAVPHADQSRRVGLTQAGCEAIP